MLHKVSANKESFHTVTFKKGLNVILAVRSKASSDKDTRNGVGKSTLIQIIDFCLGSRAEKGKGLIIKPLIDWVFTLEITLAGHYVKATRSIKEHHNIYIEGPTEKLPLQPSEHRDSGRLYFKDAQWKTLLGKVLYNTPNSSDLKYKPSYRSLISYFIRTGPDAYSDPFRHYRQQKPWDIQLNIAYLLGMNWEFASKWQVYKDKEEGVKAIEKAIKSGAMEDVVGTVGEMETQCIQLEQQASESKKSLDTFIVHPQFESIQLEANMLTQHIHKLSNQNISDSIRLERYRISISEEKPPTSLSLEKLYEESGFVFNDFIKKSLDEARAFHSQIVTNRRLFLESEIKAIKKSIKERDSEIASLTKKRARLLKVLQTHGALQEFAELQEKHLTLQGELERLKARLHEFKELKNAKRDIKAAKEKLIETAEKDHEQRRNVWSLPVRFFNDFSQALYELPGKLVIDICKSLYKYKVNIERSGSEGVEKMKIFCFDLSILKLNKERLGIDFLIHDTLMYDSVDTRQRAFALELAQRTATEIRGQYICTINSDMVPFQDFTEDFNFNSHVCLTLSDENPENSLLGIRFER